MMSTSVDYQQLGKPGESQVCRKVLVLFMIVSVVAAIVTAATLLGIAEHSPKPDKWQKCNDSCSIVLAESIPVNLTFPPGSPSHLSTYQTWMNLIAMATESIDIASYYWTLKGEDIYVDPTDLEGEAIYSALLHAGTKGGIAIRIAHNKADKYNLDNDTLELEAAGAAQVRSLDFDKLIGSGILHTKLWIVDRKHIFIGSPNMDWRALTQVKELGVAFYNCSCVAKDTAKIFEAYWKLGEPGATVPSNWPTNYSTPYNIENPMQIKANGTGLNVYLSSSPPPFCPDGRTNDIDAIINVMDNAQRFIHIAVMEYYPFSAYNTPNRFWPVIDDKLRSMAFDRGISVRLLASSWHHTDEDMFGFLYSLAALNRTERVDIEVKIFIVPATPEQAKIPFSRVNHNKYMVTDRQAYIGTSNWSEDYFVADGGVGIIVNETSPSSSPQSSFRQQVADAFERTSNWSKDYFTDTGGAAVIVNETTSSLSHDLEGKGPSLFRQDLADVFERDWNSQYASFIKE